MSHVLAHDPRAAALRCNAMQTRAFAYTTSITSSISTVVGVTPVSGSSAVMAVAGELAAVAGKKTS